MTDIKRLARRGSTAESAKQRKFFVVINTARGLLAICNVCPRYHCDIRRASHPVWHQSYRAETVSDAEAWWEAHTRTDIHQHYQAQPEARALWWRRAQAQQTGSELPSGGVVPFPYGIDRRNLKGRR